MNPELVPRKQRLLCIYAISGKDFSFETSAGRGRLIRGRQFRCWVWGSEFREAPRAARYDNRAHFPYGQLPLSSQTSLLSSFITITCYPHNDRFYCHYNSYCYGFQTFLIIASRPASTVFSIRTPSNKTGSDCFQRPKALNP